jgi:hypothetical protein
MEFINFEEQVGKIRVSVAQQIENLFEVNNNVVVLDCGGEGLSISTADGTQDIASVGYDNDSVFVKTESGDVYDVMDLDTDDMVAIYENVWYQFVQKPLNHITFNEAPYGDD